MISCFTVVDKDINLLRKANRQKRVWLKMKTENCSYFFFFFFSKMMYRQFLFSVLLLTEIEIKILLFK